MSEPKTILVVDDDVELSDGLRVVLERQGYRVIQARDGQQGQATGLPAAARPGHPRHDDAAHGRLSRPRTLQGQARRPAHHHDHRQRGQPAQGLRRIPRRHRLHPQAVRHGTPAGSRRTRPPGQDGGRQDPRRRKSEPSAPAVPRAATVLLARGPGSPECFVVRRAETLRFMGGFQAFPGGRVLPSDADLAGSADAVAVQRVAAVRELFEETGVLLARRADGSFPADADLAGPRRELLADSDAFAALLRRLGLTIRPDDLDYVGTLITPPFSAVRFDTAFFTAVAPPGQTPTVQVGELDAGEWLSADAALRAWEQGRTLVSPPTVTLLEAIRGRPVEELSRRARPLFDALAAGAPEVIYFSPQVQMMPLFCDGLPPTYYTNAFLVGRDPAYLIDPGPDDAAERQRLFTLLDARLDAGTRLAGILLTHHHPDHVGAAEAVARRYGVPVLAHPWTARALAGRVAVERQIDDGDFLDLGMAPHGGPWRLEAVHTPGHAPGSSLLL